MPEGEHNAYKEANPWKNFKSIAEMDFTGIDEVQGENENVNTIYDLGGRRGEWGTLWN